MYSILLVEDDPHIREILTDYFSSKGQSTLRVDCAADGEQGLYMAYERPYDLLLLDINLPVIDGFEVCREVRRQSDVPIIFITARAAEADLLSGYALGCDDYIVKPFALAALYQKVNALIRRDKGLVRHRLLTAGDVSLNPHNGIVLCGGEEVRLTATEYAILRVLLENKGRIVSRTRLLERVWGYDSDADERVLDSHIKNLRKALGDSAALIKTVVRRGYRLEDSNGKTYEASTK